jgi:catalase
VQDSSGGQHWVEQSLLTGSSVLFDAVYVPGGSTALLDERDAIDWICEAYRHCKPIAVSGSGADLLGRCPGVFDSAFRRSAGNGGPPVFADGLLVSEEAASERFAAAFLAAIAQHRFWQRKGKNRVRDASGDRDTRGFGPARAGAEPDAQPADL